MYVCLKTTLARGRINPRYLAVTITYQSNFVLFACVHAVYLLAGLDIYM